MKKNQLWAVILPLFILFFASCNNEPVVYNPVPQGPGVTKLVNAECEYTLPITAPRYGCTGKRLQYDKVVGFRTEHCASSKDVNLTDKELNDQGYFYGNNHVASVPPNPSYNPNENFGKMNWSDIPWGWLVWILLLGIVLYVLYRLFKGASLNDPFIVSKTSHTSKSSSTSDYKSEAELLERVMAGMSNCDVSDVAVEFPNGPRIRMKGNGKKKQVVKKEEQKPTDQK